MTNLRKRQTTNKTLVTGLVLAVFAGACGGGALDPDLTCQELAEAVSSYEQAVEHFDQLDQPELLDPDGNGIPCEQDFTQREIEEVFGQIGTSTTESPDPTTTTAPGQATTTTPDDDAVLVGQFDSAVGGTTPRVCQRWEEEEFAAYQEAQDEDDDGDGTTSTIEDTTTTTDPGTTSTADDTTSTTEGDGEASRHQDLAILVSDEDDSNQGGFFLDTYFGFLRQTPTIEVGQIAVFCLFGFDFGPVEVQVTHPGGSTSNFTINPASDDWTTDADPLSGETVEAEEGDIEGVQWVVFADHPLGTYTFTTDGDLELSATVEIVPAGSTRIDGFVENRGGFPDALGFALSGFEAGGTIPLAVYRDITDPFGGDDGSPVDHQFEFLGEVPSALADSGGAAIVFLEDGDFGYEESARHCLATILELIPSPVCDNFRGGWFDP